MIMSRHKLRGRDGHSPASPCRMNPYPLYQSPWICSLWHHHINKHGLYPTITKEGISKTLTDITTQNNANITINKTCAFNHQNIVQIHSGIQNMIMSFIIVKTYAKTSFYMSKLASTHSHKHKPTIQIISISYEIYQTH